MWQGNVSLGYRVGFVGFVGIGRRNGVGGDEGWIDGGNGVETGGIQRCVVHENVSVRMYDSTCVGANRKYTTGMSETSVVEKLEIGRRTNVQRLDIWLIILGAGEVIGDVALFAKGMDARDEGCSTSIEEQLVRGEGNGGFGNDSCTSCAKLGAVVEINDGGSCRCEAPSLSITERVAVTVGSSRLNR